MDLYKSVVKRSPPSYVEPTCVRLDKKRGKGIVNKHSWIHPLVLVAGGSGGHVFPAVAVAEECQKHDSHHPVVLLTDPRGRRFLTGYERLFHCIEEISFPALRAIPGYLHRLYRFFYQLSPQAVLGFGGKMSLLPMMMACLWRKRCGIYQSDLVMGTANRWLAPWMKAIFVSQSTGYSKKERIIGTPVRSSFRSISPLDPSLPLRVLVLGGSQGASFWSELLPKALRFLTPTNQRHLILTHQCSQEDEATLKMAYEKSLTPFSLFSFTPDLASLMEKNHLILSRAGASTLAEIATAGRPAFLIPYPHATHHHQRENAKALVARGGGWMEEQDKITPEGMASFLRKCLQNPDQLRYAGEKGRSTSHLDAAARLYRFCIGT